MMTRVVYLFILVRHSNKKRDNVAKSRPGSNTDMICANLLDNYYDNMARLAAF